jgi:polysaccharide export outer membrane protein
VRPAGLVYVVGEVNRPGGFTIPPGRPMTVLQALAMAQGLGSRAAPGRGMIVREGPGGERQELPVDLHAVLKGEESPPVMLARDVLYVPENGVKSFGLGLVNALVRMVTLRGLVY